jgi:predicted RecA/RadA family phage recombinase
VARRITRKKPAKWPQRIKEFIMSDTTAYGPTPSSGLADFKALVDQGYHTMPWTNGTAANVLNGDPVVVNGTVGIAVGDIDIGKKGTLLILTATNIRKKNEAISQGAAMYWDPTGNPYLGTAGSGAVTATAAGNYYLGRAIVAAGSTAERVRVLLIPNASNTTAWGYNTYGNVISGGVEQDTTTTSATQNFPVGTLREYPDGRKFRYSKAGAGNITRALMQQAAAAESKFIDITQTGRAQVVGATSITTLCTTGSASPASPAAR